MLRCATAPANPALHADFHLLLSMRLSPVIQQLHFMNMSLTHQREPEKQNHAGAQQLAFLLGCLLRCMEAPREASWGWGC
jgi:hypothetical protein